MCGCILHNSDPADDHALVKTSSVNDRRTYKVQLLMGILNDGQHIYAKVCLGGKRQQKEKETKKKNENKETEADRTDDLTDTIDLLNYKLNKKEQETLSKNIQSKLCELQVCIGRTIEKVIYNEGLEFSSKNKNIAKLKKIDAISWLNDRNKLLLSYVHGITGVSSISTNKKKG